jgi:hypothetical protein
MALGLRPGDPDDEVLGAWLAKEYLRDVYLTEDPTQAAMLLDRMITGCLTDEVDEIVSLGNTLKRWRTQILAHHLADASNGPTEAMNLLVKKRRCGPTRPSWSRRARQAERFSVNVVLVALKLLLGGQIIPAIPET